MFWAKNIFSLCALCFFLSGAAQADEKADLVVVNKSERMLYLKKGEEIFKSFPIVLGENPIGHKQQEGDQRTPEGRYVLDFKNKNSKYYKSIHISYPNEEDVRSAKKRGVNPGRGIVIHGSPGGIAFSSRFKRNEDWTDGCIAVGNSDMNQIWNAVDVNTPIVIVP